MKYLLIDGNNLAIRSAFANKELRNADGIPTGVHYGVMNSLINLKQSYPEHQFLIVWDGKSKRRVIEAQSAVAKGLIKSGYKENRKKDEQPQPLLDFYEQSPFLRKGIDQIGIPQIRLGDYEADDVIASYCKLLGGDNEVICVTSDDDYLQLLSPSIKIWDGMKQQLKTEDTFKKEYGISPNQWIDVGALMGDSGDNIFGLPSWGDKTALEAIQQYGSWQKLYDYYHKEYAPLRQQFPDLTTEAEFKKLTSIATKSGKPKYAEITIGMPYTGVTLAVEEKKTKNISKNVLMALMFQERVPLAYSLKKMDDHLDFLPPIEPRNSNKDRFIEYLDYYDIKSVKDSLDVLIAKEG